MIKPKKSLGQHFLIDQNIIGKIVSSIKSGGNDRIIEIGPGAGALTGALLEHFEDVHAIELDQRAVKVLKQSFPTLSIHHGNILKMNLNKLSVGKKNTHVVGNLPYYITSQILFALLEVREFLTDAILMMQKEVAERLVADIQTKTYGILSVQTQLMSTPQILFPVSRHCFSPPPNVESAVVCLSFDRKRLACSDVHLKKVVRTAFNQRRKKLSNSLKPILAKDIQPKEFNFDKRAEAWPPALYEKLTERLEQDGILT